MRQAAMVIERQVPLSHHHMYDVFGVQLCEWEMEEEPATRDLSVRADPQSARGLPSTLR
jgi:hypothetical protein